MIASQLLLSVCVAATIRLIHAKIPYTEIDTINIFDNRIRNFELHTIASTREATSFFQRHDITLVMSAGMVAMRCAPYVSKFAKLIPLVCDTLDDRSEWRSAFTKAISDETMYAITASEIRWMKATMQTIQTKIKLLGDENSDDENRKTIASIIHTNLCQTINFFDLKWSLFRKYPLMGTPPLIQLASMVAVFTPLAKSLIPLEAKNPDISCKMLDMLLDFRPRLVHARLRELRTEISSFKSMVKVMSLPYNPHGYNNTDPGEIDCEKGCSPDRNVPVELCLEDKFSRNSYNVSIVNGTSVCVENYAGLVRYRVEELFPIALLDQLCTDRKPKIPTGFGWYTINIQLVYVFGRNNGKPCVFDHFNGCDPSIKLFINDELVQQTPKLTQRFNFDANVTFTTAKIRKNSTIKIETWHMARSFWDSDGLIHSTEGNIDSFLSEPLRQVDHIHKNENRLETISFWRDEYQ